MITKDDVKKLADLARIEVTDEEAEKMSQDMGSILGYVSQVKEVAGEVSEEVRFGTSVNALRDDTNPNSGGEYTDKILREAPETQDGFIKVKKIL